MNYSKFVSVPDCRQWEAVIWLLDGDILIKYFNSKFEAEMWEGNFIKEYNEELKIFASCVRVREEKS